ncbi:MAG: hypothetical protein ACRDTE_10190, partial [Pseudonocardiaceae bacterium]
SWSRSFVLESALRKIKNRPHLLLTTMGLSPTPKNISRPAETTLRFSLAAHRVTSAAITVHRATLIDLNRDHHAYEWTDVATADLNAPQMTEGLESTVNRPGRPGRFR